VGCQLTKKIKFVVYCFSTSRESSVEKGGVSHPLGESRAAVLYYSDPSPPPKNFFKFNAPSTHLLQEEIRGPPRPRRRQLQSQWDYHEPEEIRGPPKPRDTLVFSPVIWRKKSEDHLDLGTLFICHPEENFQINKVGTNIVGSESTFSVDTSGTKNPATVSENPSFPTDQEISELPYSEEKSRSSRVSSSSELLCFELCFEKKIVNSL